MIILNKKDEMVSQAQKIFTDREEPQEAFERKLEVLQKHWQETFLVLNYYGIGGIGKSSLLYRLCDVIDGRRECRYINPAAIDCDKIVYDFEDQPRDEKSIMLRLRKLLKSIDGKFQFPLYDAAITLYVQKSGEDIRQEETVETILSSNAWLNSAVTAMGILPGVGWLSTAISSIDMVFGAALEFQKRRMYEKYLNEIMAAEAPEILKNLRTYFMIDLKRNMMEVAKRPIVIFLDTYEKFHDDLLNDGIKSFNDDWLWNGRNSIVRSVPGIMWVVMGRERLQWYDDDPTWKQDDPDCGKFMNLSESKLTDDEKHQLAYTSFEQHRIGDLGENDAKSFLKNAGIPDEKMCDFLYRLTNGTPVFLDLCVNQYHSIEETRTPVKEDFGDNLDVLISRYLNTFDADTRELTYFLASLGVWTKDSAKQIADAIGFHKSFYKRHEEYVNHSFINVLENDGFAMHDTVRQAVLKCADPEYVTNVMSEKLSWLSKEMEHASLEMLGNTINSIMELLTDRHLTLKVVCENIPLLYKAYTAMENTGDYRDLLFKIKRLYDGFQILYPKSRPEVITQALYMDALNNCGYYLESESLLDSLSLSLQQCTNMDVLDICRMKQSMINTYLYAKKDEVALKLSKEVYTCLKENQGEEHPDTLRALNDMGRIYNCLDRYEKAKNIKREVYNKQKKILGELHPDTLSTLSGLGDSYRWSGDYITAKELYEKAYEQRKELLGEMHPKTLLSLKKVGDIYRCNYEYKRAKVIYEEVYNQRVIVYGEDHPQTLLTLRQLGDIYRQTGQYQKSYDALKKAYDKNKQIWGKNHKRTLLTLSSLGRTYGQLGMFDKALEATSYVYTAYLDIYGENHKSTYYIMDRLGVRYIESGNYEKALSILQDLCDKIKNHVHGSSNALVNVYASLGTVYEYMRNYHESMNYYRLGYEGALECYNTNDPILLMHMNNMGIGYRNLGQYEEALKYSRQAYEKQLELYGEDHPETIKSSKDIGLTCLYLGDINTANQMLWGAYNKCLELYGEEIPFTLEFMDSIGVLYEKTGETQKAIDLYKQLYIKQKKVLGEEHPLTGYTVEKLKYLNS